MIVLNSLSACMLSFALVLTACPNNKSSEPNSPETMDTTTHKHTNKLARESSPYLKQHAHNPVDWYPWSDEAWSKAKEENKLVLISIGYSACHWCHVMEHESFEDEGVAKIMNDNFICIKVDREERPDVDQVYMSAVQIMTGSGGWPLNCFTLPDGRPIYGGTYFPKTNWTKILHTLADYYKNDTAKVLKYAEDLTDAVKNHDLIGDFSEKPKFTSAILNEAIENWKKRFDSTEGGPNKAPKFPLPNNYQFLLRQQHFTKDASLLKHVNLTLEKMAYGGINDQIGGGFARYSTDKDWKVPHFEKMLYDNAQLVSLYSEAYQQSKNPLYKKTVYETLEFIRRELTSPEGTFYSALDADSEGKEGKYYIWTQEELQSILGQDTKLYADYYNVNKTGYWEDDHYILLRKNSDEEIARRFGISVQELTSSVEKINAKLLAIREKRIHPGLDDKVLTSWNALMIRGYADAYKVFHENKYLDAAEKCANHILKHHSRRDGGLLHTQSIHSPLGGEAERGGINGFLEDYSFTMEALVALYQATFDEKWLMEAQKLMEYSMKHFHDPGSTMFYFTSDLDTDLIARKMEIQDNVIPASNSSMALTLFYLGTYFDNNMYLELSEKMLSQVQQDIIPYGSAYSNWAMLMQYHLNPFFEIAIVGKDVNEKRDALSEHYLPNAIFVGESRPPLTPPKGESLSAGLPLLENKYVEGKTLIYICVNKTCKLPTENTEEALKQLR